MLHDKNKAETEATAAILAHPSSATRTIALGASPSFHPLARAWMDLTLGGGGGRGGDGFSPPPPSTKLSAAAAAAAAEEFVASSGGVLRFGPDSNVFVVSLERDERQTEFEYEQRRLDILVYIYSYTSSLLLNHHGKSRNSQQRDRFDCSRAEQVRFLFQRWAGLPFTVADAREFVVEYQSPRLQLVRGGVERAWRVCAAYKPCPTLVCSFATCCSVL